MEKHRRGAGHGHGFAGAHSGNLGGPSDSAGQDSRALAAVVLGVLIYFLGDYLARLLGWPIVPPLARHAAAVWRAPNLLPDFR